MKKRGHVHYRRTEPTRLLTSTGGYLEGYTHTLNPYVGCAFACTYCYVRKMPVALFRQEPWGSWVDMKTNPASQLARELRRAKERGKVFIFMSSATDPYQPAEYREQVTRRLLEAMCDEPPDFLWVQTRSPLVMRDTDLFVELGKRVRVSVTVETDREDVRRKVAPQSPPVAARFRALEKMREQGIDVQATIAPVMPYSDQFAARLYDAAERVGIDGFSGDGMNGKRSESLGMKSFFTQNSWEAWYGEEVLERVRLDMLRHFPPDRVKCGRAAFLP